MAIRDAFKVTRKTFVDPKAWVGYDQLKAQTSSIWAILKAICSVPKPTREETFAQAMTRLNLNEADLQAIVKNYRLFALSFFILGLSAFAYAFYLLFMHATFLGWLLGMCVCALFMSQAFRFDFWSLQIRKRKLGMTFAEWKQEILGEKRDQS